ncbi:uncharacterized protein LOC135961681 [Calliphora vicina]|uniref:uncharacterized protein LOC135961681 n=1 Tax=Calliphora vicina TaxID=7373 RepID=UPI00325B707B
MKCMSRPTLGVVIGGINIFGFSITVIYIIVVLCDFSRLTEEDKREHDEILSKSLTLLYILLAICVFAIIISGLLVAGIVKGRHSLMRPWICCAIVGIGCQILRLVIGLIVSFGGDHPFGDVFVSLIVGLFTLGIQFLVFLPIYKLYKEMRDVGCPHEQEQIIPTTGGFTNDQSSLGQGLPTQQPMLLQRQQQEQARLNAVQDNPPTYSELERSGKL